MVSPVARGFSCRTEGCWTEIEEGFFSLLDPFSILLTQRLTAVGISVSACLLLWEEVWSVEDIALSGSQPDAASMESLHPELPVPLETHSSVCFPCSSSFQCHIPWKQCFISSSVSSCTKRILLAWATAHLGKRRSLSDGLQWRVCLQ